MPATSSSTSDEVDQHGQSGIMRRLRRGVRCFQVLLERHGIVVLGVVRAVDAA